MKYLPIFNETAAKVGARVKAVKVTFRGSWSVVLESAKFFSLQIELGRALTPDSPVNHLRQVVDNLDRAAELLHVYPERIDARYRNAFAAQLPAAYLAPKSGRAVVKK